MQILGESFVFFLLRAFACKEKRDSIAVFALCNRFDDQILSLLFRESTNARDYDSILATFGYLDVLYRSERRVVAVGYDVKILIVKMPHKR